jgi:hypothetical protein
MELSPVPAPELIAPYDITVHLETEPVPLIGMSSFFTMLNLVNAGGLVGTSLQETRSVKEFLDLLKAIIVPDFKHFRIVRMLMLRELFTLGNILSVWLVYWCTMFHY